MIRGSWRSWPTFAKRAPKFIPRVTPCNWKHPRRAAAGSTTGRAAKSTITVVVAKRPSCLNPRAYRLIQFLESLAKLFEKIVVKHITSGIGEFERTGHVVSGGRRKGINHLGPNLLTVVPSELDRSDLPKQNAMLLMEAPSSGSYAIYLSPLHLTHHCHFSDRTTRQANLVSSPGNVLKGRSSGNLYDTLIPCRQTSLGDPRNDHRISHLRYALSPRMHHDLPFLVHRRCPPPPPHLHH